MKYIIIGLTIFLVSCAALGSRTKIYNRTKVQNIKTVGLITKRFDQEKNNYHQIIKAAYTQALLVGLRNKDMFKVVVLDTMENERLNIHDLIINDSIDALLVAEWKLSIPQSMTTDSKVRLILFDAKTREPLLMSRHGTKFGNSYWAQPSLPRTLLDATEGALNTMAKHFKSR